MSIKHTHTHNILGMDTGPYRKKVIDCTVCPCSEYTKYETTLQLHRERESVRVRERESESVCV